MSAEPVRGSCLCGAVAFEVSDWISPIQLCHATRCRKATGGAYSPEIVTPASGFRWLRGEDRIRTFTAPLLHTPPAYTRAFCSTCGSPLPVELEAMGTTLVILCAGTLDSDPGTRPFRHAFVGQKACWHELADELPRFDGQPPLPE